MLATFDTAIKYTERKEHRHQLMMEMQKRSELSNYLPSDGEVAFNNAESQSQLTDHQQQQVQSSLCAPSSRRGSLAAIANARKLITEVQDDDDATFVFTDREGNYHPGLFRARPYQEDYGSDSNHQVNLHDINLSIGAADNRDQPRHGGLHSRALIAFHYIPQRKRLPILAALCMVIVLIGISVGIHKNNNNSTDQNTPVDLSSPAYTSGGIHALISTLLVNLNVLDMTKLNDNESAQSRAIDFLAQTPTGFTLDSELVNVISEWTSHPVIRPFVEAYVLAVFFFSTSGADWKYNDGWTDPSQSHCNYEGITCSMVDVGAISTPTGITSKSGAATDIDNESTSATTALVQVVTNVTLNANNLEGMLPTEIGILFDVLTLDLSTNRLVGSIPSTLFSLLALDSLYLQENELTGSIPEILPDKLGVLVSLSLYHNFLDGTIPSSIGLLGNLEVLLLNNNRFSGELPTTLGTLSNLNFLRVADNHLVGHIPSALSTLANLWILDLGQNDLTGSIPSSLTQLTWLVELHLYKNRLTGTIPEGIDSWKYMTVFAVDLNQLNGSIPTSLWQLTDLHDVQLSRNKFTGSLPASIGDLTELIYFEASKNTLHGSLPESIGNLANLKSLHVDENLFTGALPASISKLSSLLSLEFYSNFITGTIPSAVCSLRTENLASLTADCNDEVACSCCTSCF